MKFVHYGSDSALRGRTGLFPEISVYLPMADTPSLLLTSRTTSRGIPLKLLTDPSWAEGTKHSAQAQPSLTSKKVINASNLKVFVVPSPFSLVVLVMMS